jgi:glycosyltransferase involved in cell wall biosynthesis
MVELGCPAEKITVAGNGVDANKFAPLSRVEARRSLRLPLDRSIVICVGNLIELKGLHVVLGALARLKKRRPDVFLVAVGEGSDRALLEKQVRELGLGNDVLFAGRQPHDQLARWFSAADVFCLASSSEGWPNVVLEALACGVPVIATPVGSVPEIVPANVGILAERRPEAFESAIERALFQKWNQEEIVSHAHSYGWNKVAESLMTVYQRVVCDYDSGRAAVAGPRSAFSPY